MRGRRPTDRSTLLATLQAVGLFTRQEATKLGLPAAALSRLARSIRAAERLFIGAFEKPRSKVSMHPGRATDDLVCHVPKWPTCSRVFYRGRRHEGRRRRRFFHAAMLTSTHQRSEATLDVRARRRPEKRGCQPTQSLVGLYNVRVHLRGAGSVQ